MKEFLYIYSFLFSCLLTKKLCLHGSSQKSPRFFFLLWLLCLKRLVCCLSLFVELEKNPFSFLIETAAKCSSCNPSLEQRGVKTPQLGCKLPYVVHCSFIQFCLNYQRALCCFLPWTCLLSLPQSPETLSMCQSTSIICCLCNNFPAHADFCALALCVALRAGFR